MIATMVDAHAQDFDNRYFPIADHQYQMFSSTSNLQESEPSRIERKSLTQRKLHNDVAIVVARQQPRFFVDDGIAHDST